MSPMLQYWVEFFDDLQHVRGRSLNTVSSYRRDLELYGEFKSQAAPISAIYDFLRNQGLSQRSIARAISSIRTYLRYLETRGIACPELRDLHPPKVTLGLPKPITTDEFKALMDSCSGRDENATARNRLVLLMLLGLGCRVSELVALNIQDFREVESVMCVTGKGGKQRLVPITAALNKELSHFVRNVRPILGGLDAEALLINEKGRRPSRIDIWRWLQAWSAKAGFEKSVHPHQFRHGCATALLDSGADLRSIQMILGHSNIQTTQVYTAVATHNLKEAVDEAHPLSP